MQRIVITGSHCVGKTTLVQQLSQRLLDSGVTASVAEEPIKVILGNFPDIARDKDNLYIRLAEEHFRRLQPFESACRLYDRSLIDLLAYYRLEGPGNPHFDAMLSQLLKWYSTFIDLFIYLPIEIPLIPDGHRPESEGYRKKVDVMLHRVAAEASISWHPISGTMEERVHAAFNLLVKHLQLP
ncbi:MAG: ATP-binding protein [Pseudomonadota bacterium]